MSEQITAGPYGPSAGTTTAHKSARILAGLGLASVLALSACGTSAQKTVGAPSTPGASSSSSSGAQSSSPSATPSPKATKASTTNLALGTPITVSDRDTAFSVSVGEMQTSAKAVSAYGEKPKGTYAGLTVTYDCTLGSCDYNPFDFTMRSADGTEVDQAFGGFEPALHSGTLNVGTKAKGIITYDLAAGTYSLEYRNGLFDGDAASWVVTVA